MFWFVHHTVPPVENQELIITQRLAATHCALTWDQQQTWIPDLCESWGQKILWMWLTKSHQFGCSIPSLGHSGMAQAAGYLGNALISTQHTKGKGLCFTEPLNAKKGWKFTLHNVFVIVLKAMRKESHETNLAYSVVLCGCWKSSYITRLLRWVVVLQVRADPLHLLWPITGISPNYYVNCYGDWLRGEKAVPYCSPAGWPHKQHLLYVAEGPVLLLHI